MILGAHESTAGGLHRALDRAVQDGAEAVQVFTSSPRQWRQRNLSSEEVSTFCQRRQELGLSVLSHAGYLLNPASPEPTAWKKTKAALVEEIQRCGRLGIPHLVLHPGSHKGAGVAKGIQRAAALLESVLETAEGCGVTVLLENTAGAGNGIGHELEHLAQILDHLGRPDSVACLFDTCHGFAAGYSLHPGPGLRKTLDEMEASMGIEKIHGFHLNDALNPRGSRRDRHAVIGEGRIGLSAMVSFVSLREFRGLPAVLETPPLPDGSPSFALGLTRLREGLTKRAVRNKRRRKERRR